MDHQRAVGHGFNRGKPVKIDFGHLFLLQMHIADRNRQRVASAFGGKPACLRRIRHLRGGAGIISDKTDLRLDGHAMPVRQLNHRPAVRDILLERQRRSVIHHRGETGIDSGPAFIKAFRMVDMRHDRHRCRLAERAEHHAGHRHRQAPAKSRAGLKDHRTANRFGSGDEGLGVFPAEDDGPHHRMAFGAGRRQNVCQAGYGHRAAVT